MKYLGPKNKETCSSSVKCLFSFFFFVLKMCFQCKKIQLIIFFATFEKSNSIFIF